jgi:glycosidase
MACTSQPEPLPTDHFIPGIARPLRFSSDTNTIFLSDFVPDTKKIDSVFLNGTKTSFKPGDKTVSVVIPPDFPLFTEMRIWNRGGYQSVPVMKSRKTDHAYTFDPRGRDYQSVQLMADFNGWTASRTPLELKDGKWATVIPLDPGQYQYQLVLDGVAGLDPANPDSIDNNVGGFNSVLKIGVADKSKMSFLFTKEIDTTENEIEIGWTNKPDGILVFWQNILLNSSFLEMEEDELEITIPAEAENKDRSFIRIFAYNGDGPSNDLVIPLKNRSVVTQASQLDRTDAQSRIIYNVFVDRFFNGDSTNDEPIGDPTLVLPPADFHGGDIAGVTQKIKEGFFNDLGVNTIWISPVVLNPKGAYGQWNNPKTKFSAYHGYWPISFTQIDPRFGTPEELKEMVKQAHDRGISVLLDFVAHHVHELHPYYIQHPNWTTSLYLPDGTLNTEKWDEHRLTTWFDVFLPTLDLQQPEVTAMLSDSAAWWIREYGLDGFRHDATKHVPEIFWRELTRKLKVQVVQGEGREVYQIGETYGGPQLISSYVQAGMLDGQFDFNVYDAAVGVFARQGDPFTNLDNTLHTSFDYYGWNNQMGYITGNQDRGRFISYAGGDLKFNENAKAAGWTRYIGVGDDLGYKKLSMLTTFNMTIPGLPVIYYGDELGIPGGNDPDSRRMMKFDGLSPLEAATRETARKLAEIRKNNLALTYGIFQTLQVNDRSYVYIRQYFDQTAIIIFNKSDEPQAFRIQLPSWLQYHHLKSNFGAGFLMEENQPVLRINLEPWSFEILVNSD